MAVSPIRPPFDLKNIIHNNQVWHWGIVAGDHFDDPKVQFYMNNLIAKLDEQDGRYWLSP